MSQMSGNQGPVQRSTRAVAMATERAGTPSAPSIVAATATIPVRADLTEWNRQIDGVMEQVEELERRAGGLRIGGGGGGGGATNGDRAGGGVPGGSAGGLSNETLQLIGAMTALQLSMERLIDRLDEVADRRGGGGGA